MAKFEEWSPWVAAPEKLHAPLAGDARADICIIGGGYTGLTCALALRESGAYVHLVNDGVLLYG